MSERRKEFVWAAIWFALSALLAINAVFGKVAFGIMSISDTRLVCIIYSLGFAFGGVLASIGDKRLNEWINPRLEVFSQRREGAKARRKARQAELDLMYPSRVIARERRKRFLHGVVGLVIFFSPLIAVVVGLILTME